MKRLISFLGTGDYKEATYQYKGKILSATRFMPVTLKEAFEPNSVFIVGTDESEEKWIANRELNRELDQFEFEKIGTPKTPEDSWEIFNKISNLLSDEALESESKKPEQIILDITHGFRAQPLFALSAVNHILSEWLRRKINPPLLKVVYGAFEARDKETNIASIWDLTNFVLASQWETALNAFLRFGRADDIAALAKIDSEQCRKDVLSGKTENKDFNKCSFPKKLGDRAKNFADDLSVARLKDIVVGKNANGGSAKLLLEKIKESYAEEFIERLPPVRTLFLSLEEKLSSFISDSYLGKDSLRAYVALVNYYARLQRYSEMSVLIREGLTTLYDWYKNEGKAASQTGKDFKVARYKADRMLTANAQKLKKNSESENFVPYEKEILVLANKIVDLRNDIQHAGINPQPLISKTIIEKLLFYAKEFESIVDQFEDEMEKRIVVKKEPLLVNLSNHPIANWTKDQLNSAKESWTHIADLEGGMPVIPSDYDYDQVEKQAIDIAERALKQGATAAYVAGEYNLTYSLINQLKMREIECYNATTERYACEIESNEESIKMTHEFKFGQWRKY